MPQDTAGVPTPAREARPSPFYFSNEEQLRQLRRSIFGTTAIFNETQSNPLSNLASVIESNPIDDAIMQAYNAPSLGQSAGISPQYYGYHIENTVVFPESEPEPPQYKFPIGSIVKWNINEIGVPDHLVAHHYNLEFPLIKIIEYIGSGTIYKIKRFKEIDDIQEGQYDVKYFIKATPSEVEIYEKAFNELRPCTERPAVGTVVRYIGNGSKNGKRALIKYHSRNDGINISWFVTPTGTDRYNFSKFQIAKDQSGSFVPDFQQFCTCQNCKSLRPLNKTTIVNDIRFCDIDCAVEGGYDYCRNCGVFHKPEEFSYANGNAICHSCYDTYYRECHDCSNHYHIQRMRRNFAGNLQCEFCRRYGNQIIHSYDYKPSPIYNKMAYENTRYLGIELEIEVDNEDERQPMAEKINTWLKQHSSGDTKQLHKLVYLKNDGSLENGIEIVFHPFTLKSLHKNFPIKYFLEFLSEHDAGITSRCGMHVHVSKDKLSKAQLLKGKWLFFKCQNFLKKFSERREFKYCNFEDKPTNDPYRQEYGRRTALNVAASLKTLEVRIFQATLDYKKFMANLQFSDAFVDYIQHGCGANFLITQNEYLIWENFIDYCKRDGKWQILTNWILQKGIV